MIEETARVVAVENDQLLLEAQTKSSCGDCSVRQGCGTSVLSNWVGRRFTRFRAANTVDARVGDEVVVGLAEAAMLKGSVFVYLLPLLAMITSAVAVDSLLAADAWSRELLVLLAAASGFASMLVISRRFLSSAANSARLTPVVLRKNIV